MHARLRRRLGGIVTATARRVGLIPLYEVADLERRFHKAAHREEAWLAQERVERHYEAEIAELTAQRDALLAHLRAHDRCPAWPGFKEIWRRRDREAGDEARAGGARRAV